MKTRIYIDGYNFYYGCLKCTPYKWLDLVFLFENHILPSSCPEYFQNSTTSIKYFTADIVGKAATPDSIKDQQSYHRALKALYPEDKLTIIKGYYAVADTYAFLVDQKNPSLDPRHCERAKIWKLEEKQSDVNIAVEALYDVLTDNEVEHVVFVTNDTDLEPALKKIKQTKRVKIGLVVPTKEHQRFPNAALISHADWTRDYIRFDELEKSQMSRVIDNSVRGNIRKPIVKPMGWFGSPKVLQQIFDILKPALGSHSKCWQWLSSEKPDVPGLPKLTALPSEMLHKNDDANKVLAHAKAYAKHILEQHQPKS